MSDKPADVLMFLGAHGWLRVVSLLHPTARSWVEEYRQRGCEEVNRRLTRAIKLMHQQQMESARVLLARCSSKSLDTLQGASPSISHALDCWYYSAAAYYHYRRGEFELVDEMLNRSVEEVAGAIEEHSFLMILATRFCDVELQRAQAARNQHHWKEMEEHTLTGRDMLENRRPLHVLDDGTPIYVATVKEFLDAIQLDHEDDKATMEKILGARWLRRRYRGLLAEIYALPWLLIPYP